MTNPLELKPRHYLLNDFLCQCGCGELPTDDLVRLVDQIAEDSGITSVIHSAKRCEAHNVAVGGAHKSAHIDGIACDLHYSDALLAFLLPRLEHYKICMEDPRVTKKGLWLHVDLRSRGGYRVFKI